jgi:L-ascorbate metabolism protein UlaG (beta-lactamase superfamily)
LATQTLYLRSDVQLEPLFNQWRAWTHLIPPATAAMRLTARYLPKLASCAAGSSAHNGIDNRACRDLLEKTLVEQEPLLELAAAIKSLGELLENEAKGFSLAPLYEKIPTPLKGYVELLYDANNHPHIKFLEGLLYRSRYYVTSSQSFMLSIIKEDKRDSGLELPRTRSSESLQLRQHFSSREVDVLSRARRHPTSFIELKEQLKIDEADDELFQTFLSEVKGAVNHRYAGERVRVRYFGHATVLIETSETSILIDPVISYRYASAVERFTYDDLPDHIDYILITHGHQDHLDLESLLQLRYRTGNVVVASSGNGNLLDPSLKLLLQNLGFDRVLELNEMDNIRFADGQITAVPFLGEHSDLDVRAKTSYAVRVKDKQVLCLADSCNFEPLLYEHVRRIIGDVDILFLGMECEGSPLGMANGPYLLEAPRYDIDQSRRTQASNYDQAIGIVDVFKCPQVYVYAMGQEPWLSHLFGSHASELQENNNSLSIQESDKLVRECRSRNLTSERLFGKKEFFL